MLYGEIMRVFMNWMIFFCILVPFFPKLSLWQLRYVLEARCPQFPGGGRGAQSFFSGFYMIILRQRHVICIFYKHPKCLGGWNDVPSCIIAYKSQMTSLEVTHSLFQRTKNLPRFGSTHWYWWRKKGLTFASFFLRMKELLSFLFFFCEAKRAEHQWKVLQSHRVDSWRWYNW